MGDLPEPSGIDWVQLKKDMDKIAMHESGFERIIRKCKENPLVPIGTFVTVGALCMGIIGFKRGENVLQQRMMRLRVVAQFFTVCAAVGGVFMALPKEKRNLKDFIESGKQTFPKSE